MGALLACTLLLELLGGVAASKGAGLKSDWVELPSRWSTTSQPVNASAVIRFDEGVCAPGAGCAFAAIQTGPVGNATKLEALYKPAAAGGGARRVVDTLLFTLQDTTVGAKTRLEATNCFVTDADLLKHGVDPSGKQSRELQALHFVYQNCSGAAAAPSADVASFANISYSLMLPADFSPQSQAIMGQFHGRPDPRIFLDPTTNRTKRLSTAEAFKACSCTIGSSAECKCHGHALCTHCNDGEVGGGKYVGWRYKQGGYPPLTFAYTSQSSGGPASSSWWNVFGRSDDRLFVPKADCSFNPSKHWPTRACPGGQNEQVHGIWRAPFEALPLGVWLDFDWRVVWSAYAKGGGAALSNGSVAFRITEHATGKVLASAAKSGFPLGRHDDGRAPFFKIGMYNPSGDGQRMQVSYRGYREASGLLPRA